MKCNSAAENLMLCHLDTDTTGRIGQTNNLTMILVSGNTPSKTDLDLAFNSSRIISTGFATATIALLLSKLGGISRLLYYFTNVPKFGALANRRKRGYVLTGYAERLPTSAGTINYALVGITPDNSNVSSVYVLSVGLIGSGADIELESLDLNTTTPIKFNNIVLDHNFLFSGME